MALPVEWSGVEDGCAGKGARNAKKSPPTQEATLPRYTWTTFPSLPFRKKGTCDWVSANLMCTELGVHLQPKMNILFDRRIH